MVTPPVALASFAAAGVGEAPVMKTSASAFGLSLVAFFVPFSFIFDPAILWQGTAAEVAVGAGALLLSTALWAIAFGGWCGRSLGPAARAVIGAAGLVAVIAPFGSAWWLGGIVVGWVLAIGIAVRARRGGAMQARLAD